MISSEPSITWLSVTIKPPSEMTNPDPSANDRRGRRLPSPRSMKSRKNSPKGDRHDRPLAERRRDLPYRGDVHRRRTDSFGQFGDSGQLLRGGHRRLRRQQREPQHRRPERIERYPEPDWGGSQSSPDGR